MAPGSRVKSEYMKRYREPRWDEYAACYRELLRYRLGRRLLEQAHAPWLWDAWGPGSTDDSGSSASSGAGSPAPRCASASPPPPAEGPERRARGAREERPAKAAKAEKARDAEAGDAEAGDAEARDAETRDAETRDAETGDAETRDAETGDAQDTPLPALPGKDGKDKPEEELRTTEAGRLPGGVTPRPRPSALFARENRKGVKSPQRSSSKIREKKHPFALYGWGEKQTDTGSQKTHNVCASAPVHEIHESALRAKTRRQGEKRRLVAQRQRAHSVDVEKGRRAAPGPSESPWVTEYMRCYSARA